MLKKCVAEGHLWDEGCRFGDSVSTVSFVSRVSLVQVRRTCCGEGTWPQPFEILQNILETLKQYFALSKYFTFSRLRYALESHF